MIHELFIAQVSNTVYRVYCKCGWRGQHALIGEGETVISPDTISDVLLYEYLDHYKYSPKTANQHAYAKLQDATHSLNDHLANQTKQCLTATGVETATLLTQNIQSALREVIMYNHLTHLWENQQEKCVS